MGVLYEEVVHYYKTVPTEYSNGNWKLEIMLVCSYARASNIRFYSIAIAMG